MTKYFLLNFLINTLDKANQNEDTFFFLRRAMLKLITAFFALSFSEEVSLKYQSLNLSSTKTDASKSCSASMTKHVQLFARRPNRPLKKCRNSTRKLSNDQPTFAWEPCHFLKDITARNRIRQLLEESFLSSPFCQLLLHKQRQRQMCLHHVPQITIAELFLSFTIWLSILLFLSAVIPFSTCLAVVRQIICKDMIVTSY